jgi:dCMP deaminase
MKQKFIDAHMKVAEVYAELSSAKRLHVGAIIVKDDRIISIGYNGMPSGWDNDCEDKMYISPWNSEHGEVLDITYNLKTKPEVLHAETNAIAKLARTTESGLGATMFVTHAPCIDCAKLVYQSGINSVYYRNSYRNDDGIEFLKKCNVEVIKYD